MTKRKKKSFITLTLEQKSFPESFHLREVDPVLRHRRARHELPQGTVRRALGDNVIEYLFIFVIDRWSK